MEVQKDSINQTPWLWTGEYCECGQWGSRTGCILASGGGQNVHMSSSGQEENYMSDQN